MPGEAGRDQRALDDLRHSIHTPESWARAVASAALELAADDDAFGESPVEIDAKIVVEQRRTRTAVDSDGVHTWISLCMHVGDLVICWFVPVHGGH